MHIPRNDYGALINLSAEHLAHARELLNHAIKAGKLDAEYNDIKWHRRHGYVGWCLNYDVYDITASAVLVQRRETEKTQHGTSPRKDYYIIRRCGKGVRVTEAPKTRVVKLAKVSEHLGQVIDTLEGRAVNPLKQASPFADTVPAYKIVESRDGSYWSVYDESLEWALCKTRIQAATADHSGGYYVFPTVQAAKAAFERNVVFHEAWQAGKELVLVECEVAGRHFSHDNGKECVTFCRPVRVIETLVAPLPVAA